MLRQASTILAIRAARAGLHEFTNEVGKFVLAVQLAPFELPFAQFRELAVELVVRQFDDGCRCGGL